MSYKTILNREFLRRKVFGKELRDKWIWLPSVAVVVVVLALVAGIQFGSGSDAIEIKSGAYEFSTLGNRGELEEIAADQELRPQSNAGLYNLESPLFIAKPAARTLSLTGFTRARTTMTLVAEESGRCMEVLADIGEEIGPDGVFAKLDPTFIQLDLDRNRAEQTRLNSDVRFHSKEMQRYKKLVKGETAAQTALDSRVKELTSARQQLEVLKVEEKRLLERLDRLLLKAPAGWKVSSRNLEAGEWIVAGTAVADLGRFDVLLVPYALTNSELSALRDFGENLKLYLPEAQAEAQARIARIAPDFDPETRKIMVDLEVVDGDFVFRGGLRTVLNIPLPDPGGSVLAPINSLIKAYEDYFLIRPDGKRVKVLVLGDGPEGAHGPTARISSPEISAGQSFLLNPVKSASDGEKEAAAKVN